MPFDRSTLTQRRDEVLQDIAGARITDTTTGSVVDATMLQTSPLRTLGYGMAAAAYEEDGYIDWLALQAVPWTATGEWATAWGALVGVYRKPATPAGGSQAVIGPAGQLIPAGTQLTRQDGFAYASQADVVIPASGTVQLPFTATAPGAAGNAAAGTQLGLTLTIPGVTVAGPMAAAITGGADLEPFAAFRSRYLAQYAAPPQGGDANDYLEWALGVPGVSRAWINPLGAGAGSVVLYVMLDAANAAQAGFPQGTNGVAAGDTRGTTATGDQLTVANSVYTKRPVTALVYVCAPIAAPVPFQIHPAAAVPAAVQAAVLATIDAVFLAEAGPLGTTIQLSAFEAAIAAVPGMPEFTLLAPAAPIGAPLGSLPVRGPVTYV